MKIPSQNLPNYICRATYASLILLSLSLDLNLFEDRAYVCLLLCCATSSFYSAVSWNLRFRLRAIKFLKYFKQESDNTRLDNLEITLADE